MITSCSIQALRLSQRARLEIVHLVAFSPAQAIQTALRADRLKVEHLDHGIDMWRDPEAVIKPSPTLNVLAMWMMQHLLNPFEVKVIYGDVVFAGRSGDQIVSLTDGPLNAFHGALELAEHETAR